MKRLAPAVAGSILFVLLALAPSVGALDPGFTKCSRVQTAAGKAKVTVRGVACSTGKDVARGFFERISSGDDWDGRASDGSIYYEVNGFRCGTGLGGSQGFCHHRRQLIETSVRTDDPWPY